MTLKAPQAGAQVRHAQPTGIDRTVRRWSVAPLLTALLLGGCADPSGIVPQSQPLDADQLQLPDHSRTAASEPVQWPEQRWWQAFADPQLEQWLTLALQHSPTLEVADARVRQALYSSGLAQATDQVQLAATASLSSYNWPTDPHYGSGTLAGSNSWNNQAWLRLSYDPDLFGRNAAAQRQALSALQREQAQRRLAELDLTTAILHVYIDLALNHAQRDIANARLEQQRQIAQLNEKRVRLGLGTRYELSQARSLLPVTQRQLRALDEAIALDQGRLATLSGQAPIAAATLQRPALSLVQAATLELPSQLPLALVGQRPDLVAARWNLAALAGGIDFARADFYPNLNLLADLGQLMTAGSLGNWALASNRASSAGLALSLPILDGGARRARLGIATAEYDGAVAQYNATLLEALRQIDAQLVRSRSATDQLTLAQQAVTEAEQVYRIAQDAFSRGLTDYLHVLDAQTRLFDQQAAREQVIAQRLQSYADLNLALGGGVHFERLPQADDLQPQTLSLQTP